MSVRARLIALTGVVAIVLATGIVVLVGSRSPGCAVAAPRPSLPAELRSLGDFDQSYDVTNAPAMADAAERAASTLHSDLIGAIPQPLVFEAAAHPSSPDAVVVPLRSPLSSATGARLAGLVVFLRDCQGAAYFSGVEDDATAQPPLERFPPVSQAEAAAQLGGVVLPRLVYTTDPLHPLWATGAAPPRSLPAR
ncbi:MAG: hypothetical protein ABI352_10505 [Candidatus Dormibacter sp.]